MPVHQRFVRLRQLAAILFAHSLNFPVDALLLLFELGGFAGRQLSALDTLRDTVLLIFLALADFALEVVGPAIVLVDVNLVRQVVLLVVQLFAVGGG